MKIVSKIITSLIFTLGASSAIANVTLQWDPATHEALPEKYWGKLTEYHYGKNDSHQKNQHVIITIENKTDPNHTRTLVVIFGGDDLAFATTLHTAVGKYVRFENELEFTILADEKKPALS